MGSEILFNLRQKLDYILPFAYYLAAFLYLVLVHDAILIFNLYNVFLKV